MRVLLIALFAAISYAQTEFKLGTNNWGGHYQFTSDSILLEGSQWLHQFSTEGQTPIKIQLVSRSTTTLDAAGIVITDGVVHLHEDVTWVLDNFNIVDMVTVQGWSTPGNYWINNGANATQEILWFQTFTRYLYSTYCNTDKLFFIQTWEGDNHIGTDSSLITDEMLSNMADWLQARHKGVVSGRDEFPTCSLKVLCGAEVNKLADIKPIQIIDHVIPHITLDFVSYSFYEWDKFNVNRVSQGIERLNHGIDVIGENFQNITEYGLEVVGPTKMIIGELGAGREQVDVLFVPDLKEAADTRGVRYGFFWNMYNNEAHKDGYELEFQLRRPDDTISPILWELTGLTASAPVTQPTLYPSVLPTTYHSQYPSTLPTEEPTSNPTLRPSTSPTSNPTFIPSTCPTFMPTSDPSFDPTSMPTSNPTAWPTNIPTFFPSMNPSSLPTATQPSIKPSHIPSASPSVSPTKSPTCASNVCQADYDEDYEYLQREIDSLRNELQQTKDDEIATLRAELEYTRTTLGLVVSEIQAKQASLESIFSTDALSCSANDQNQETMTSTSDITSTSAPAVDTALYHLYASGTKCEFGSNSRVFKQSGKSWDHCFGHCAYVESCLYFSHSERGDCIGCSEIPKEIAEGFQTYAMSERVSRRNLHSFYESRIEEQEKEIEELRRKLESLGY